MAVIGCSPFLSVLTAAVPTVPARSGCGEREEDLVEAGLAEREVAHPDPGAGEPAERVRGELAGGLSARLGRNPGGDDGRVGLVADDDLVVSDQVAGAVPVSRVQQPDPDAGAAHGVLQLAAGAGGDHPAMIDDRDPVGELVGFVEVLGGEHHRRPVRHDGADDLPQCGAAARVEAGGRLVQEQQVGSDDDAGREV
jgi:hypothetical protein